jgi:hypothetical protein
MNSTSLFTSTQFQNWKADCMRLIASHETFEVQDVNRTEYEKFCVDLCESHQYTCVIEKRVAICSPPVSE